MPNIGMAPLNLSDLFLCQLYSYIEGAVNHNTFQAGYDGHNDQFIMWVLIIHNN